MDLNILEELIGSKARIKMLKVLANEPDIHVTIFFCKVGCRSGEGYRNLKQLEEAGVIKNEFDRNKNSRIIHLLVSERRTKLALKIVKILSEDRDEDILRDKPKGIVIVNKLDSITAV